MNKLEFVHTEKMDVIHHCQPPRGFEYRIYGKADRGGKILWDGGWQFCAMCGNVLPNFHSEAIH